MPRESGLDIESLVKRAKAPITRDGSRVRKDGNPQGPLYGERLVFTGALEMPRREAAELWPRDWVAMYYPELLRRRHYSSSVTRMLQDYQDTLRVENTGAPKN